MHSQNSLLLDSNDIGRIIDALRIRAEAWSKTAAYLQTDNAPEHIIIEDTDDPDEALAIAHEYLRIVKVIESQAG